MGVKRLIEEDNFQELCLKQAKRLDCEDNLAPFSEDFAHYQTCSKADIQGDRNNSCKLQLDEAIESDDMHAASNVADKDLETSIPLSWATSISGDDSVGFEDTSRWSHFPENFDFLDPNRGPYQLEDGYSSLLNNPPSKKVPIGLNHQADLPPWDPNLTRKGCSSSNCSTESEQKLMGTCIIPMPDLNTSTYGEMEVGCGRSDCGCLDEGSTRCVEQHVNEAREKIKQTFGDKNFMELGFYEMGEEMAHKWTKEEEVIFHEVVYSNPVSLGKRFWKHLAVVFPARTKKEIVCYYYNVFILRRRVVQNRSKFLEIDSDDDEWQGMYGGFCRLERQEGKEEEEESIVESFGDQDIHEDHLDYSSSQNDDGDDDEHDGDGDEDGNDVNDDKHDEKLHDGFRVHYNPSKIEGDLNVEEHVSLYSKTQSQTPTYFLDSVVGPGNLEQGSTHRADHTKCSSELTPESNDDFTFGFAMGSYDANIWDDAYSTGLKKSVDLLPTSNMIEEIFGPRDSWIDNSDNEKKH